MEKRKARSALKIKRLLLDVNMTSLSNSLTHTRSPLHPYSTVTPKHHTTKSVREVTSLAHTAQFSPNSQASRVRARAADR